MSILKLKKLKLGYGENIIVKDASFEVNEGDFVCVVGANGSGKSTLIKGILGLLKPLSGQVEYGEGVKQTAIGYLPQENHIDTNFPTTVWEVVLSGTLGRLGSRPFYGTNEKRMARESLGLLKIARLANKSFAELSGGQKQKVLLARSLAATTKLLILDEPSNNLDYETRGEFYQILKKLNTKHGISIIMITHDLDAEDLIGNKVIALKEGVTQFYQTKTYLESYR